MPQMVINWTQQEKEKNLSVLISYGMTGGS